MRINFFQLTSRRQTSRQDKVKSSLPLKQGKSPKGGMGYSETGEVPRRGMGYDVSLTFRMVIPALSRELKRKVRKLVEISKQDAYHWRFRRIDISL